TECHIPLHCLGRNRPCWLRVRQESGKTSTTGSASREPRSSVSAKILFYLHRIEKLSGTDLPAFDTNRVPCGKLSIETSRANFPVPTLFQAAEQEDVCVT